MDHYDWCFSQPTVLQFGVLSKHHNPPKGAPLLALCTSSLVYLSAVVTHRASPGVECGALCTQGQCWLSAPPPPKPTWFPESCSSLVCLPPLALTNFLTPGDCSSQHNLLIQPCSHQLSCRSRVDLLCNFHIHSTHIFL